MQQRLGKANLYIQNPGDKDAILAEIKAYAEANPELPFIRGEAWNLGVFPERVDTTVVGGEVVYERH